MSIIIGYNVGFFNTFIWQILDYYYCKDFNTFYAHVKWFIDNTCKQRLYCDTNILFILETSCRMWHTCRL